MILHNMFVEDKRHIVVILMTATWTMVSQHMKWLMTTT